MLDLNCSYNDLAYYNICMPSLPGGGPSGGILRVPRQTRHILGLDDTYSLSTHKISVGPTLLIVAIFRVARPTVTDGQMV